MYFKLFILQETDWHSLFVMLVWVNIHTGQAQKFKANDRYFYMISCGHKIYCQCTYPLKNWIGNLLASVLKPTCDSWRHSRALRIYHWHILTVSGLLARYQNTWSQDGGNMRVIANGIDHWPVLCLACGRFLFCFVCFFTRNLIFQDKIQLYKPNVIVFNECFPLLWHFFTSIVKTGQGNLLSLVSSSSFVSVLLLYVSCCFASKATSYLVIFFNNWKQKLFTVPCFHVASAVSHSQSLSYSSASICHASFQSKSITASSPDKYMPMEYIC